MNSIDILTKAYLPKCSYFGIVLPPLNLGELLALSLSLYISQFSLLSVTNISDS